MVNFASQVNSEFRLVKIDKISELTFELSFAKTTPSKILWNFRHPSNFRRGISVKVWLFADASGLGNQYGKSIVSLYTLPKLTSKADW